MEKLKNKKKNAIRQLYLDNVFTVSSAFAFLLIGQVALANECAPEEAVARVESLQGQLILNNQPIAKGALVCTDDLLATGLFSRAALRLFETQTLLRLDQQTQTRIQASQQLGKSWLEVLEGMIHLFSRDPRALEVDTPLANAAVEGTEFVVRVTERQVQVTVVEGDVQVTNNQGALRLDDRQTAFVTPGRAPQLSTLITPEEAVQWTLYYPPVLLSLVDADQLSPSLRTIHGDFNNAHQALTQLARVPFDQRNEDFFLYQAGWLLAVGQVSQAQRALDQALEVNPASAPARALKAIIAVTQNDELMALALAKEAIQSDPDSAAGYLALSYAQQAAFQLDEALDSVQQAMARDSDNALAKGRLAELLLAQGKLDEAVDVAEQAAVQTPDLAHTQTVLGFAYLSRIDTDRAKGAFERAIALDQAAPLPRLGLGLAQIRESDLEDGRTNIETAVALDPLRSLYRSYLGKAYFEEKRDALAADQYALAKQLDPMDPTPWLYDAILKQTQNRPVEALEDIQQSIALNDNRAVYRSRLLLDEDLAARGTSLARIYDDLGFEQLAVTEASRSLSIDPGNHSAHRFLADAYATRPRHEIARVSELLQSQLLQPVNLRPVQPSLAVVDLNLLADDSSSQTALNEYTTLFEREQLQLTASGLAGNNETWSDEVIFSGLFDRASFSFGQFHSETDGFRDNNDVENDIYNVFAQFAISPSINLQAEYRKRETSFGDLGFFLDRENFDPKYEYQTDHDVARIGLNFATSSLSDALLSITYSDRDVDLKNFNGALQTQQRQQGLQIDGQYLTKWENLSSILGYLHYNFDASTLSTLVTNSMILTDTKGEVKQNTFYVYNNFRYPSSVIWTIGLSYDSYNDGEKNLDLNELNPKFGAYWFPTDRVQFRFAYFETLKRRLVANETLEPTQIAGFNQFFDDTNGTVSKRLGIGADFKLANTIQLGAEVSRRDLDTFFTLPDGSTDKDLKDEELYRVYLFWTPNPSWAINFEYAVDNYKNDDKETVDVPVDLETSMVLMGIRHFRQNGLFLELRLDHIWQDIVSREQIGQTTAGPKIKDDSSFFVFDASVGYRLPRRRGVVTLEINNIFDKQFNFISNNFRSTELKGPRYIPSRSVFLRAAFHF